MELRPYQKNIIRSLRESIRLGNKRVILCAPTGAGKTILFCYMISNHLKRGGRAIVFTHRKELLNQAGNSFDKFDLSPELITAGSDPDLTKPLHVSMIETFDRRKDDYTLFLANKTLVVIDEAHLNNFTKIFDYIHKDTIVIGATATPYRKGKNVPSLEEFYTDIVQEIDTPELLELGYLAKPKTYGIKIDLSNTRKKGDDYDTAQYYEENKIYEGVVQNWKRLTPNTKTLLFASNVDSSKQVCNEFNISGYLARHIDGNTPKKEREDILEWFDKSPNAILCNCGILNAGFDQPDIETVILYRATTSLPLYLQMVGRGSRTTKTKSQFNILDFGNNVRRLKFWQEPRVWTLKKDTKKQTKEDAMPLKECPSCAALLASSVKECEYCGHIFIKTKEEKDKEEIAYLQELKPYEVRNYSKTKDNIDLVRYCKAKLISPFWVLHNKKDYADAVEFCVLMGYKKGFIHLNKDRFEVFRR